MGAGAKVCVEQEVDGLVLRHEADPTDKRPELSGHFHPKLRMTLRGKNLSRRCFILSGSKIILPAFGSLTGGLDARHPEIKRAIGHGGERSEEHTSELQSLMRISYAVFCLKQNIKTNIHRIRRKN